MGVAALLEFADDDELLDAIIRNRNRRAPTPPVIAWIVASMSSGEWLRPYTINRSLMRPMMNSSSSKKNPESPVRGHGSSGVPADGATSFARNVLSAS